jgi:PAS domain S-box-containing protein
MILPQKTLLVVSLAFASLFGSIYATSSTILLNSQKKAEEQNTRQIVERVLGVFAQTQNDFSSRLADWAAWDDSYTFIEDGNKRYIESGLAPEVLSTVKVNLVLYIHTSGRMVFGTGFDLKTQKNTPIPEVIKQHLSPNDLLFKHSTPQSKLEGIFLLPKGPMLIASRPIVTTQGKGPIRGTLIYGRYLDADGIKHIAQTTRSALTVYKFNDPNLPADFRAVRSSLLKQESILVNPLSEQTIGGYALLKDIYGKPALLLRVDLPREIYQQGQNSLRYLIVSLMVVALVFGCISLVLLERAVRSQKNQQLAEEKYRSIFENAAEGIFQTTPKGQYISANPALARIYGYESPEDLIADLTDIKHQLYVEPTTRARFVQLIQERGAIADFETQIYCKDGRKIWISENVRAVCNSSGELLYYEGTVQDITKRKQAEESYLRVQVAEAAKEEVCKALEKEKELGLLKSRFVSMTSHEFRTPLTTILSSAELLQIYGDRWTQEKKLKHLLQIQTAVKHMTHLLNDVLLIGKAEAGKLEYNPELLDLDRFCHSLVDEIQIATKSHTIIFVSHLDSGTQVYMDEKLLRHILSNLLSNAVKYSPQGGTVNFDLVREQEEVVFRIQDQGIGIPIEDRAQLFNSFHRASNVGTISGTGLGLAIVKKAVDLHGGKITVDSEVGIGTTFIISLPLHNRKLVDISL